MSYKHLPAHQRRLLQKGVTTKKFLAAIQKRTLKRKTFFMSKEGTVVGWIKKEGHKWHFLMVRCRDIYIDQKLIPQKFDRRKNWYHWMMDDAKRLLPPK